jgi:hypothetical protein
MTAVRFYTASTHAAFNGSSRCVMTRFGQCALGALPFFVASLLNPFVPFEAL